MSAVTLAHIHARCIEEGDCLIWQGATDKGGYPAIRVKGRTTTVRRIVVELDGRPARPGQPVVCACDDKKCVKTDHLVLWTRKKVSRKASKTGYRSTELRCLKSARSRQAAIGKITMDIARDIRASTENGVVLSKRYGINETQISRIRRGLAWKEYDITPFAGLGARS